jgi:2-polyprenyl-3-methyl-5-hydroxy-6-metoxy-1,4-benzoquinol methylase
MSAVVKKVIRSLGKIPKLDRLLWHGGQFLEDSPSAYLSLEWQSERVYDHFTNTGGTRIPLIRGLRDQIKPGWQAMLKPQSVLEQPASVNIRRMDSWREKLARVNAFLSSFSIDMRDKDVLEIGSYDGVTACALAEAGAGSVLGIDIAAYYINQAVDGEINEGSIARKNSELDSLRQAYIETLDDDTGRRVSFLEDDICASSTPSRSKDIIFSWEVMEHVADPAAALSEMYRMLRPGGVVFHEYNPFFSIDGGHSLCTLDFIWGHARLSDSDFVRYLQQFRPDEVSVAASFYRKNLNRMALADLQTHIVDAGFHPLSIIPWQKKRHLDLVSRDVLDQCVAVYPSATISDLISPVVWVLLQKK